MEPNFGSVSLKSLIRFGDMKFEWLTRRSASKWTRPGLEKSAGVEPITR